MEIRRLHTLLFSLAFFCCLPSFAQNNTATGGKSGKVTVTQSADIDALVNGTRTTPKQQTTSSSASTSSSQAAAPTTVEPTAMIDIVDTAKVAPQPGRRIIFDPENNIHSRDDVSYTDEETVTGPKIMRGARKVRGYRIQVFAGGNKGADRKKAEQTGIAIKKKYPSIPVYVHFYSPRWICHCGNFHKYKEAEDFIKNIKKLGFPEASIVRSTIVVSNKKNLNIKPVVSNTNEQN